MPEPEGPPVDAGVIFLEQDAEEMPATEAFPREEQLEVASDVILRRSKRATKQYSKQQKGPKKKTLSLSQSFTSSQTPSSQVRVNPKHRFHRKYSSKANYFS
jgi:hypothetical protein